MELRDDTDVRNTLAEDLAFSIVHPEYYRLGELNWLRLEMYRDFISRLKLQPNGKPDGGQYQLYMDKCLKWNRAYDNQQYMVHGPTSKFMRHFVKYVKLDERDHFEEGGRWTLLAEKYGYVLGSSMVNVHSRTFKFTDIEPPPEVLLDPQYYIGYGYMDMILQDYVGKQVATATTTTFTPFRSRGR
jgi:hypothetical protein